MLQLQVQYGRISDSGMLELSAFRSCRRGQQLFLSYGIRTTNFHSLLYYGQSLVLTCQLVEEQASSSFSRMLVDTCLHFLFHVMTWRLRPYRA